MRKLILSILTVVTLFGVSLFFNKSVNAKAEIGSGKQFVSYYDEDNLDRGDSGELDNPFLFFPFMMFTFVPFCIIIPIFLFTFIFQLLSFVFSIWMLIDCIQREFEDKTFWLVILIVGLVTNSGLITSLLYYLLEKKKLEKKK